MSSSSRKVPAAAISRNTGPFCWRKAVRYSRASKIGRTDVCSSDLAGQREVQELIDVLIVQESAGGGNLPQHGAVLLAKSGEVLSGVQDRKNRRVLFRSGRAARGSGID